MANFKTPLSQVLFRAHMVGLIAAGLDKAGLTENQKAELEKLELAKTTPIGLTSAQQKKNTKLFLLKTKANCQRSKRASLLTLNISW